MPLSEHRRLVVWLWLLIALLTVAAPVLGRGLLASDQVTYTGRPLSYRSDLHHLDLSRNLPVRLTSGPGEYASPAWSPDGQHLAFIRTGPYEPGLYLLDAENWHPRRAISLYDAFGRPAWSPDGARLAFRARVGGSARLVVYDRTSGRAEVVNVTGASDSSPIWSPDGHLLLFLSYRDGNPRLYALDIGCLDQPDGCRFNEELYLISGLVIWPPVWSPDGHQLAFASPASAGIPIYVVDILCHRLDPSCIGRQQRVADDLSGISPPSWSPDGTRLAFLARQNGINGVYVWEPGGSTEHHLVTTRLTGAPPIWLPDGDHLIVEGKEGDTVVLYLVHLGTGEARLLNARGVVSGETIWRPAPSG